MANPEHLAKLKEGAEAWTQWRRENPSIRPHLTDAYLEGQSLSWINLAGSNLSGANLHNANLCNANLDEARIVGANLGRANLTLASLNDSDLSGSDLRWADIGGALLCGTNLTNACLSQAKLHSAYLMDANLSGADLREADLSSACLGSTNFGETLLKDAVGLDSCRHTGPSYLDFFTLQRSLPLPLSFLRGCGLPDEYIEYLPSLLSHAIHYHSCFISHSTKDKRFAERLYSDLQNRNVRCWYAPEDLKIGDPFQDRIERSIHLQDKFLLILSKNSVESPWVEDEVQSAIERERKEDRLILFPISIDDAVETTSRAWAAKLRRTRHIGDFSNWKDYDSYKQALDRLLRDLKAQPGAESPSSGEEG
jgi:TIR domain/Pentapeptide repeats (8 copies)